MYVAPAVGAAAGRAGACGASERVRSFCTQIILMCSVEGGRREGCARERENWDLVRCFLPPGTSSAVFSADVMTARCHSQKQQFSQISVTLWERRYDKRSKSQYDQQKRCHGRARLFYLVTNNAKWSGIFESDDAVAPPKICNYSSHPFLTSFSYFFSCFILKRDWSNHSKMVKWQ